MVMDAVPLIVVARNLGDADTRMVEKHYGYLATSYVREAIRAAKPLASVNTMPKWFQCWLPVDLACYGPVRAHHP